VLRSNQDIGGVHFFGSAWSAARDRLVDRLRTLDQPATIQWEPLEILLEMCADPDEREVGGAPQVAVANQHGLSDQFLVPSPEGNGDELWFAGRPLGRQRSDLRALRFITKADGRFDVQPYYPEGLSIASAEILRAREDFNASVPSSPEFDSVGAVADQLAEQDSCEPDAAGASDLPTRPDSGAARD
jgi:hypothetical protein